MNAESGDGLEGLRITRLLVWLVYSLVLIAVLILGFAFFFKLTDANPAAGFVDWIYGASDTLASPFREIWAASEGSGGSVFDWSLLFAIFMYALLAIAVHAGVTAIDRRIYRRKQEQWLQQQQAAEQARAYAASNQPQPPSDVPPPPPPPPPAY